MTNLRRERKMEERNSLNREATEWKYDANDSNPPPIVLGNKGIYNVSVS